MANATNLTTIAQLVKQSAKDFIATLSPDENVLFQATKAAETLLQEVETANNQHKDASVSRKTFAALLPFIAGVDQYGQALDVFANSNELLCPIWGSIRVVLHLAKEFGNYFDKIVTMLEDIGETLKLIPRCLRLYPNNEKLHSSVKIIFKSIFDFSTKAKHVFRMGRSKSNMRKPMHIVVSLTAALRLLWKPFEVQFGCIRDDIAKSVADIETEADLAEKEIAHEQRARDDIRWSKAETSQRLLAEFIDDQSWMKVTEWLSPANVAANHKAATSLRHADSGTWFLESEAFQKWLDEDNSFLWLHAIPGAGKTVLASSIINYLQKNVQSRSTGVAYFYCDYKDAHKQEPSKVLGTILASLTKQNRAVFDNVQDFFLQLFKDTSTFNAEFDELKTNFSTFITGHFQSVIIVIDALDECAPSEWRCLGDALLTLRQCGLVKILVTSRNELLISRIFENLPSISIEEGDVTSDISGYITAELSKKITRRDLNLRDPTLELRIRKRLVERCTGMFQWAKCQIEELCRFRNDKAIEAALANLPKTLHDTYNRILERVEADNPVDIIIVRKMLWWLVRGVRDMTLDELAEAVAVDPEDDATFLDLSGVDTDSEGILNALGSLVTVSADQVVSLAHYSVREFLVSDVMMKEKPHFWVGQHEVEAELAAVCLTYLCYDDFTDAEGLDIEQLEETLEEHKLYRYAAQAWALHANRSEKQKRQPEQVVDLTMRLLRSSDDLHANFSFWVECYQHCNFNKRYRKRIARPMFVAAFFGLTEAATAVLDECAIDRVQIADYLVVAAANGHAGVIEALLHYLASHSEDIVDDEQVLDEVKQRDTETKRKGKPDDQANDVAHQLGRLHLDLSKALYAASSKGHTLVVSLLLSNGAQIDARGGRDGTALQAAALEGRPDVVQMLLKKGASHKIACKRYGTPLSAAAEKAHQRTCEILLRSGANPNGSGGWHSLPLVSAIVGKNMNVVRKLIDAGADLNRIVGGRYGGPLPAAAALGMNDLIKELVSNGAKVNDNDDKASDALYAASLAGHSTTVDLLLGLGADVNAKGGRHRNALGVACAEGHYEVVQMLLASGADLKFFDEHWGNALQAAAQKGFASIVTALAQSGMDLNATAGGNRTALTGAAANGHDGVIKALFALGVASGDTGETTAALIAASSGGHSSTVQLLVDNGANVNGLGQPSQTQSYCRPLQAAASKGRVDVLKLLLVLGAEAKGTDEGWYGSALLAAVNATSHNHELIMIILDAGADVNEVSPASSNFHGTPLASAVSREDTECTTTLLGKGADTNLAWASFSSPLMWATRLNDEAMIELLLEHDAEINLVLGSSDVGDSDDDALPDSCITALQSAAWYGHEHLVRKFVGLGAELSVDKDDAAFTSALQVAAFCTHEEAVRALIKLGSDVNHRGGYCGSALQAAASVGALEIVRILLEAGAPANEINVGHFHSALLAACVEDTDSTMELVQLLIEHGADVRQKQKGKYPYPLHAASKRKDEANVPLMSSLIEAGADVNATGGFYGTALQSAAADGNTDAGRLLLEAGADPNITGGFYHTPLQAAYRHGWYAFIWLLYKSGARNDLVGGSRAGSAIGQGIWGILDDDPEEEGGCCSTLLDQAYSRHGLDPNLEYGYYGNALQQAVVKDRGIDDILRILDAGADVNKIAGRTGTAISAAAYVNDRNVFDALIARDADINIGNYRYPNAAFGAIRGEARTLLKVLIEKGIDVKTPIGHFGTTAQCAAGIHTLSILRMLLRAGAEVNTRPCGLYGSPLHAAAWTGNEIMIRYLLRRNANVHAKGGRFGGVLSTAIFRCQPSVVELLLKKGADVNERGRIYGTPLQATACEGKIDTTLVLLRYGADVNVRRGRYGTALQAAAAAGRDDILKLLVERGADPNLVGGRYRSPLTAAAITDNEEMVRYLLVEAGATWCLVDRKKLGHVSAWALDNADQLLLKVQESMKENEQDQEQEDETNEQDQEPEDETNEATMQEADPPKNPPLLWNVDSIPNAYDRYDSTQSKWGVVREMSFHSFSKRYASFGASHGYVDASSKAGSPGQPSRVSTLRHTGSGFSTTSGTSTAHDHDGAEETLKDWDETVLDWVQV